MSSKWKRDDFESEWTNRLNNAVSRAHEKTGSYDIRTRDHITDTNSTVADARRFGVKNCELEIFVRNSNFRQKSTFLSKKSKFFS